MERTPVFLREDQKQSLDRLAAAWSREADALIREAIDEYLGRLEGRGDWLHAIDRVFGAWADDPLAARQVLDARRHWGRDDGSASTG